VYIVHFSVGELTVGLRGFCRGIQIIATQDWETLINWLYERITLLRGTRILVYLIAEKSCAIFLERK
jgi:hypothetical protein